MASAGLKPEVQVQALNKFSLGRARTWILCAVLALVTAAVYAPVHKHPFFNLDDPLDIVDNVQIHQLNWQTIRWSFTALNLANWMPLSWISHAVDYRLFGANPAGHHDMNIFFHVLDAVLLFLVLKRATGYVGRSFMVAALFALHPMNVEAVAWIAERKTLLSTLFFLLALGAYRWYARRPTDNRYTVIASLFALGLMAKPQVITLPFVLLLWDYWPLQRMLPDAPTSDPALQPELFPRRSLAELVKEKIPLLFLCVADAMLTLRAQASVRPGLMPPLSDRLKNAVFSYVLYIRKCFWPAGMAPELPHRGAWLTWWQVAGSVAILLAITVAVLAARRYRYLPVGWFWFFGMLVPMIGILQAGRQGMADRYGYQSYIGLFIMVAWGVAELAQRYRISVRWLAAAGAIVLLALTIDTSRQIGYWKDNLLLWEHGAATVPDHWCAEINIGMRLWERGDRAEAMKHLYKGSAIHPDEAYSGMLIGYEQQQQGHLQEAISRYHHALNDYNLSDSDRAHIYRNLAVVYRDLGDMKDANESYAQALTLQSK